MAMSVTYTNFGGEIIHENRGGTEPFYTSDPLGSMIEGRNSSGTQTFSATYWPYGEVRTSTGTNPSQFGFVGALGYYRESSARTYVRARFLRVELGRWMNVDPLWPAERDFGYADCRPVDRADLTGMQVLAPGRRRALPRNTGQDCGSWLHVSCMLGPILGTLECWGNLWTLGNEVLDLVDKWRKIKPRMGEGSINALRHCVWGCKAHQRYGCPCAKDIDLREINNPPNDQDSKCDLANNKYGRFLGETYPDLNCEKLCMTALKEGDLCIYPL